MYCWCGLYYKLLFLKCLSDSVTFSVYMNIFKRYIFAFSKHVYMLAFSAGNITGIFGGEYLWYCRR